MSKYASKRDELLDAMSKQGWANASSGDVDSPCDWFALITISDAEVFEIKQAFDEESAELSDSDIVGNYILSEDTQGFVTVDTFPTEAEATRYYDWLDGMYSKWLGEDEN